jgi:hypothetical protein
MKQLITWAATAAAVVLPEPPLPRKVTSFGGGPAPLEQATTMRRLRPLRPVTARVFLAETTKDGAIPRFGGLASRFVGISQGREVRIAVGLPHNSCLYRDKPTCFGQIFFFDKRGTQVSSLRNQQPVLFATERHPTHGVVYRRTVHHHTISTN